MDTYFSLEANFYNKRKIEDHFGFLVGLVSQKKFLLESLEVFKEVNKDTSRFSFSFYVKKRQNNTNIVHIVTKSAQKIIVAPN